MHRVTKFFLILLVLSFLLTACNAASEEVFDLDFNIVSGDIDLGGVNIVYEIGLDPSIFDSPNCLGYEMDTQFGDMAVKRLKDVQNNLNCTVTVNYTNNYNSCRNFVAASYSGTFLCDVISGISDMWRGPAQVGMLIGLTEIEDYIDFRNEENGATEIF